MEKLSALCNAREHSPIGFALVEVIYENDLPVDFVMRYINKSSESILGICTQTVDENYYKLYPDTNSKWLSFFHDCLKSGEKMDIQDFSYPLDKYLQIDCFPCGKNLCGCFIRDITKEMFVEPIQLKHFNKNLITQEEKNLLEIVKRYIKHSKQECNTLPGNMSVMQNEELAESDASIDENLNAMEMLNSCIELISKNVKLREENMQLQYSDSLTGHFNFECYKQIAPSILSDNPGKKYALCNCDIIRFKYINDMFGYNVGDKLLKYWADLINADLEEGETFCRIAADNMVALRQYEDVSELEKRFYKILAQLNEFPAFKNRKINVDVVSGIYLLDEKDMSEPDINKIIDKAGIARSSAKGIGSKIAYYDNAMRERQLWELQVCQNMLESLKENQFSVCFQPQYDYQSGNIIGAEALVRWNHPVFGRILPNDFIPVLEKNGLIGKLDLFVWEEACKLIRHMLNNSDKLPIISISVNVSRLDIAMKALKDELLNILERYSLSPSMLHLEITESAYIENSDHLIEVVEELRDCGFNIHMDDFGTGFSSLNILKDVPVNVLKLDMKFLSAEKNPERGGNILSSIVGMAKHIGLSVIAEGVETRKQADYLKSLGCQYMQGYYFARPMSVDKFKEYLKDKKTMQISHKK